MFYKHLLFDSGGNFFFVSPITCPWKATCFSSQSAGYSGKAKFFYADWTCSSQSLSLSLSLTHAHAHARTRELALKRCCMMCDMTGSCSLYFIVLHVIGSSSAQTQQFLFLCLINVHAWGHWKIFGWSLHLSTSVFVPSTFVHLPARMNFLAAL